MVWGFGYFAFGGDYYVEFKLIIEFRTQRLQVQAIVVQVAKS